MPEIPLFQAWLQGNSQRSGFSRGVIEDLFLRKCHRRRESMARRPCFRKITVLRCFNPISDGKLALFTGFRENSDFLRAKSDDFRYLKKHQSGHVFGTTLCRKRKESSELLCFPELLKFHENHCFLILIFNFPTLLAGSYKILHT